MPKMPGIVTRGKVLVAVRPTSARAPAIDTALRSTGRWKSGGGCTPGCTGCDHPPAPPPGTTNCASLSVFGARRPWETPGPNAHAAVPTLPFRADPRQLNAPTTIPQHHLGVLMALHETSPAVPQSRGLGLVAIYMVRNGRQTGQKTVTADASLDTEIPLGSGCRLVYICNAILITLSIFDTDYSAVSADSV